MSGVSRWMSEALADGLSTASYRRPLPPTPEETPDMDEYSDPKALRMAENARMAANYREMQNPPSRNANLCEPVRQQLAVEMAAEELEAHLAQLQGDIGTLAAALQPVRHDTETTRGSTDNDPGRPIMSTPLGNRLRSASELCRQMSAQIRTVLEELR